MKRLLYISAIVVGVIAAPFAALALGVYTAFLTFFAFIEGFSQGARNAIYGRQEEPEEQLELNIWDKHIERMKNKGK
jgi:hypothetical protein